MNVLDEYVSRIYIHITSRMLELLVRIKCPLTFVRSLDKVLFAHQNIVMYKGHHSAMDTDNVEKLFNMYLKNFRNPGI